MDRFTVVLEGVKAFALTPPVALGVPAFALAGLLAGLAMQPRLQDTQWSEMEPVRTTLAEAIEPISWPTGKVPDYVVGSDFLKMAEPPPARIVAEPEVAYAVPPAPDVPPYRPGEHGPASPPPPADAPSWASTRGDILDVSLPEDRAPPPAPTVLADAAATGMTTR